MDQENASEDETVARLTEAEKHKEILDELMAIGDSHNWWVQDEH